MFGAGKTFTLLRIAGIRVGVDWSWFLILFLVIFWLSSFYGAVLDRPSSDTEAYLLAVASAVGFFGSILLHELGHALVARRNGIGVTNIRLWIFGGVAEMDRESPSPGVEFRVAVAGPAVSALLAVVLCAIGINAAGREAFEEALLMNQAADTSGPIAMVAWLAAINLLVLGFNLLPAFPMDGGRIARAIAWRVTGKRGSATRFAAALGRLFGYLFMALGLLWVISGNVFSGVWIGMIGFLINGSARAASANTSLAERLDGVTVADVMDSSPVAVPADVPVDQALEHYFIRFGWSWFPVAEPSGRFLGIALRDRLDAIPVTERTATTVGELIESGSERFCVEQGADLEVLLGNPDIRRFGALMVTDAAGRLSGVVTVEQVGRALGAR